ncbi:hypothetical protein RN001_008388 [Aquatica leii]|uniref:La protein homolog n=1 Tax=Aquatica leii TaxID=1421715 RepID=A0AAN7P9K4_9COLE|nr:hypothetical protein RN001_008388 [Aquatica leii]
MASDLEKKIINQIEYYFSDFNLSRDKFLQGEIVKDNGWVELTTLLKFERLASYTTDKEVIVDALKKSENNVVVVNDDGTKVRRSPDKPLPEFNEEYKKAIVDRTAYAKGFPLDESLDNILKFISENHGIYESCIKRTYLDKATKERKFKGSCFIVFKSLDDCKKFVDAESVKYNDMELIRKFQSNYLEEKKQEFHDRKNNKKKLKEAINEPKLTFSKGIIIHFSGIPDNVVLTREEIKEKITEINENEPSYIDYNKGDLEGWVRMAKESEASEFHKKLTDGVMEVGDVKLQVRVLEEEEEEKYLTKTKEVMHKKRQFLKKGRRGNKRHHGNCSEGGHKNKKAKV